MGSIPSGAPRIEASVVPGQPSFAMTAGGAAFIPGRFRRGPHERPELATSLEDAYRIIGDSALAGYEKDFRIVETLFDAAVDGSSSFTQAWLLNVDHMDNGAHTAVRASSMTGTRLVLEAKYRGDYAHGDNDNLQVIVQDTELGTANRIDVIIKLKGEIVQSYRGYSWSESDERCIRDAWALGENGVREDDYVRVLSWNTGALATPNGTYQFTGGDNGLTGLDSADWIGLDREEGNTGLQAASELMEDVTQAPTLLPLVCADIDPEEYEAVIAAAITLCRSQWMTGFAAPVAGATRTGYLNWKKGNSGNPYNSKETTYGELMTIWPHGRPSRTKNETTVVPLTGWLAGAVARVSQTLGYQYTPAGIYQNKGRMDGVIPRLERRVTKSDAAALDPIQAGYARQMHGGIYLDCDWTTASLQNNDLAEISNRHLLCVIARALVTGSEFVLHMPNNEETWRMWDRAEQALMLSYAERGAFRYTKMGTDAASGWYAYAGAPYTTNTDIKNRIMRARAGIRFNNAVKILQLGIEAMQPSDESNGAISATIGG